MSTKLFEKLRLTKIKPRIAVRKTIPNLQFGLKNLHSTPEQVRRILYTMEYAIEENEICLAVVSGCVPCL